MLAFFSARLEQHPDQTLSVGVVLDVIKQGTLQWPRDRLKVTSLCSVKTKRFKVFLFELRPLLYRAFLFLKWWYQRNGFADSSFAFIGQSYLKRKWSFEDFLLFVHAYARVCLQKSPPKKYSYRRKASRPAGLTVSTAYTKLFISHPKGNIWTIQVIEYSTFQFHACFRKLFPERRVKWNFQGGGWGAGHPVKARLRTRFRRSTHIPFESAGYALGPPYFARSAFP